MEGKTMMFMLDEDGTAKIYDDNYDITIHCESEEDQKRCVEILKSHSWIPVEDQLPENDDYILLSFENFDIPLVGRYEPDEDGGGKFYVGDDEENCISVDLFVNAWMPLPEPYRPEI